MYYTSFNTAGHKLLHIHIIPATLFLLSHTMSLESHSYTLNLSLSVVTVKIKLADQFWNHFV